MFSLGYPASAFVWGVLHAIGLFGHGHADGWGEDRRGKKRVWFSVGEVTMAGILDGSIAVPAGF